MLNTKALRKFVNTEDFKQFLTHFISSIKPLLDELNIYYFSDISAQSLSTLCEDLNLTTMTISDLHLIFEEELFMAFYKRHLVEIQDDNNQSNNTQSVINGSSILLIYIRFFLLKNHADSLNDFAKKSFISNHTAYVKQIKKIYQEMI